MMAGIYIKGMEMPENCLDCHFTDDHFATCKLLNLSVYFNVDKRAVDCPLIPVPPHGRLIDADALCDGLVSNHPVVIHANATPTIIPAEKEDDNGETAL